MLVAGIVLLTVKNWASRCYKTFIMGHVEDVFSPVISTKILITLLESF
jgi:hypothetical protein